MNYYLFFALLDIRSKENVKAFINWLIKVNYTFFIFLSFNDRNSKLEKKWGWIYASQRHKKGKKKGMLNYYSPKEYKVKSDVFKNTYKWNTHFEPSYSLFLKTFCKYIHHNIYTTSKSNQTTLIGRSDNINVLTITYITYKVKIKY